MDNSKPLYRFFGFFLLSLALMVGAVMLIVAANKPPEQLIGEDFLLRSHEGKDVMYSNYNDRPKLVFFGFTNCETVCPIAVTTMSLALDEVNDTDDLYALFITTDPERDTPQKLKEYLGNFRGRFIGLTGDMDALKRLFDKYKVFAGKVESSVKKNGDYQVNHTTEILLLDKNGELVERFSSDIEPDALARHVNDYLDKN